MVPPEIRGLTFNYIFSSCNLLKAAGLKHKLIKDNFKYLSCDFLLEPIFPVDLVSN